ncbi:MAG: hypothetical protein U0835_00070 [Isosphaeraceae bacterium]
MRRRIVQIGAIPQDTDILETNKYAMIGLAYLTQAVLGSGTVVDGLACTATSPAGMTVNVGPGSIYSLAAIDATAYGSLAADTVRQVVKQGIVLDTTNFPCAAPTTAGQSVVYLIQAAFLEADGGATILPYYNASNPSQPYNGPNNSGTSNNTYRSGNCVLTLKTGVAATTGTQAAPSPDAGCVGLWTVTVANGQTSITSASIAAYPGAPFIGGKLTGKLDASKNLADVANASTALSNLGGVPLAAVRTKLTANATFYVNGSTGNDTTGTGASGAPWRTIQKAINAVAANLDLCGFTVTIQVADGTYTAGAFAGAPFVGGGTVLLQGNTSTPANCVISTTNVEAISGAGNTVLQVAGFKVQTTTGGAGVKASSGAKISIVGPMDFGACASYQLFATDTGSAIMIGSGYTISGGALAHKASSVGGEIAYTIGSPSITLTGTPAFSVAFAAASVLSVMNVAGATFTGSATGPRYLASSNSVISTNGGGANYFPGNSAGSNPTGGQYI